MAVKKEQEKRDRTTSPFYKMASRMHGKQKRNNNCHKINMF